MSKILITGGAGFIGSNFVYYYNEHHPDDEIVVLDKLTYAGNLDNLKNLMGDDFRSNPKVRFVQGDIADNAFVQDFFASEKFDKVVNFAAETHVDRSIETPDIFVMTNVVGTNNLLEASRHNEVKHFHQVSTDEVYGDLSLDSSDLFTEQTHLAPNSPYAASKAASDLMVRAFFETYKLPATITRCSNNYGPYQFPEKLIPYFLKLASNNEPLPVYGDGLNVRDWLYVVDHCSAIDVVISRGKLGEVYNVGGNTEKNNLEVTRLILEFLGKPSDLIRYVDDRLAHDRRYAIDSSKLQNELGWKPSVNFEEGIARTFQWYQANQDWVKGIQDRVQERKHKVVSEKPQAASRQ